MSEAVLLKKFNRETASPEFKKKKNECLILSSVIRLMMKPIEFVMNRWMRVITQYFYVKIPIVSLSLSLILVYLEREKNVSFLISGKQMLKRNPIYVRWVNQTHLVAYVSGRKKAFYT